MVDPFYLTAGGIVASAFVTAVATTARVTWKVGSMLDERDNQIAKLISEHELQDVERFAKAQDNLRELGETVRHEFGETGLALRQKMHDMEMWGRDNNLSKRTFDTVMIEVKDGVKDIAKKVDSVIMRNAGVDQKDH